MPKILERRQTRQGKVNINHSITIPKTMMQLMDWKKGDEVYFTHDKEGKSLILRKLGDQ